MKYFTFEIFKKFIEISYLNTSLSSSLKYFMKFLIFIIK